ncbi:hypothetical protein CORC01_09661 [Colletotrichum orchidophilum]|uniref:Uncharacterized protein n=1 Tax=Colletotrichum orchidophilum TaxID=1209926 RepID=A0A1G4B0T2_9PEZI|nr:uncharacterized protein CORC01_09661 [Colletotrichum orchidophilum]OHE95004.1 hypothetical protein CORC01_09661 [Colletotrichum orchidophilum]
MDGDKGGDEKRGEDGGKGSKKRARKGAGKCESCKELVDEANLPAAIENAIAACPTDSDERRSLLILQRVNQLCPKGADIKLDTQASMLNDLTNRPGPMPSDEQIASGRDRSHNHLYYSALIRRNLVSPPGWDTIDHIYRRMERFKAVYNESQEKPRLRDRAAKASKESTNDGGDGPNNTGKGSSNKKRKRPATTNHSARDEEDDEAQEEAEIHDMTRQQRSYPLRVPSAAAQPIRRPGSSPIQSGGYQMDNSYQVSNDPGYNPHSVALMNRMSQQNAFFPPHGPDAFQSAFMNLNPLSGHPNHNNYLANAYGFACEQPQIHSNMVNETFQGNMANLGHVINQPLRTVHRPTPLRASHQSANPRRVPEQTTQPQMLAQNIQQRPPINYPMLGRLRRQRRAIASGNVSDAVNTRVNPLLNASNDIATALETLGTSSRVQLHEGNVVPVGYPPITMPASEPLNFAAPHDGDSDKTADDTSAFAEHIEGEDTEEVDTKDSVN